MRGELVVRFVNICKTVDDKIIKLLYRYTILIIKHRLVLFAYS